MNQLINKNRRTEISIDDIRNIEEYKDLSEDEAYKILDTIKQLAYLLYEFQKQHMIQPLEINTSLRKHKKEFLQQAA